VVALLGGLVLAAPAFSDSNYSDTTGEDPGSADITTIHVANSPVAGTISFTVHIANLPTLTDGTSLEILVDSDKNPATGNSLGADYLLGLDSGGWYWTKWNAAKRVFADVPGATMLVTFDNGVLEATMHDSDIGGVQTFAFGVLTVRGTDPNNPIIDVAPNALPLYLYDLVQAPAVTSTTVNVSGVARAGHRFTVRSLSVRLSNGLAAHATSLRCRARLGGALLRGTGSGGCSFSVPRTANGKRLVVLVTGSYAGRSLAKTFRASA
jgi:hypothetical protein